ncbi:MAG: N-acetylmuramoyl-L-alanine amidase, partial [Lachnospiraceae bacterium]|nr:N-acetylmuramoyl-L-alanine amidase [Lachnospiraceae bacterium]
EEADEPYLLYLVVADPDMSRGDSQTIYAGIGNLPEEDAAVLVLQNESTGKELTVTAVRYENGPAVFSFTPQSGRWYLRTLLLGETEIALAETGIAARFGVDREVATDPDDVIAISDADAENEIPAAASSSDIPELVRTDLGGTVLTDNGIEDTLAAIDAAENGRKSAQLTGVSLLSRIMGGLLLLASPVLTAGSDNIVVMIDPGHDKTHGGANNKTTYQELGLDEPLYEEVLTLKIAKAMRDELAKHEGVTVYMTRETEACPFPGKTNGYDLEQRTEYAKEVGADVYISIHLNAWSAATAKGAEVYIPNNNYRPELAKEAKEVALLIIEQLKALGLTVHNTYYQGVGSRTITNIEDLEDEYPDGSAADYYSVIRNSKKRGIPAMIVEHCYITNAEDAAFLAKEENIIKLGQADAAAVLNYIDEGGLKDVLSAELSFANRDSDGDFDINVSDLTATCGVSSVYAAVWRKSDQSDLHWYDMTMKSAGKYTARTDVAEYHGSGKGTYNVHLYIFDWKGEQHFVTKATYNNKTGAVVTPTPTATPTATPTPSPTVTASPMPSPPAPVIGFTDNKDGSALITIDNLPGEGTSAIRVVH